MREVTAEELLELVQDGARVAREGRANEAFIDHLRELTQRLGELLSRDPNVVVNNPPIKLEMPPAPKVNVNYTPPPVNVPAPTVVVNSDRRAYEFVIDRNDRGQMTRIRAQVVDE